MRNKVETEAFEIDKTLCTPMLNSIPMFSLVKTLENYNDANATGLQSLWLYYIGHQRKIQIEKGIA